jgi:arylsulfatase A-like enzyme
VNRDFSEWLSHNDGPRPFFAFLNYYDAHEPYLPPKPFDMTFGTQAGRTKFLRYWGREATRSEKTNMSPDEIQAEVNAYDTSIAYIDYQVKLLLRDLQSRGLLENTLLIITSDHGEQFGNHGFFTHGNSLYLPSVHVPLIISFPPAVPNGVRVVEAVSLRNIPATVLDILQFAEGNRFPGTSLARYWDRRISPGSLAGDVVLSELSGDGVSSKWNGAKKSLLANGKYYIKNADDREELYDIEHDPLQQHNLLRSEEGRRWNEKFRTLINHVVNGVYLR